MSWHIHVDGASSGNPGKSGAGIIVRDDSANIILTRSIFLGEMTNNMAEYEALLRALEIAVNDSVKNVTVYTDSQLVANQINGTYKIKNMVLFQYVRKIQQIIGNFDRFAINYIPREKNRDADKLAKDAILKG
ncbi:MAG: ribonuclease HI family protein [Syntrophorhabdaceae bacterium]